MTLSWVVVALTVAATSAWRAEQGTSGAPVEWIVIDGGRQPSLLPQWLVWENTFSGINTIREKRLEGSPLDSLTVTRAELRRIEEAAAWFGAHRNACAERQEKAAAALRTARRPARDVDGAQRAVILECRQQVLNRADTLLQEMSVAGRAALLAYVESKKSGMWSRVARSELEFYRRPR